MSDDSEPKRFRVEVIADDSGEWCGCGNGLSFDSQSDAEEYAKCLAWRWTSVREWRVLLDGVPLDPTTKV